MKALVTGATGFVGPYLLRHLRACGDEVIGAGDAESGFDVVDRDGVLDAFTTYRPDVVYHLAARSHVGASWHDPIATLRVNVEGTANVLDAAVAAGVRRVLVVGSAEEYGRVDEQQPLTEDTPARPLSPYGASKAAAALLALQAQLAGRVETVRVRPFSHTGPGQSAAFVVPAVAARVAAAERDGLDEIRLGARTPVRDFSDVRDVVAAYALLLERGARGETYNICSGRGRSIRDVLDALVARSSAKPAVEVDPERYRRLSEERNALVGDAARIRALGWAPAHAFDDTLDALFASYRAAP